MPRVRTLDKKRKPPAGYELIESTLEELNARMREAEREPHEGKRKCEPLWPIFRIHHQRSRYIYDMFYKRKAISKELYEWCLREKIADKDLIAKWKKSGYERLCCLRCIQADCTAFGSMCICRVPKRDLSEEKLIECVLCGCRGCASEAAVKDPKPPASVVPPPPEPHPVPVAPAVTPHSVPPPPASGILSADTEHVIETQNAETMNVGVQGVEAGVPGVTETHTAETEGNDEIVSTRAPVAAPY
eukprot:Blabericola_migrator_1__5223@NODE_268_length_10573_cov_173_829050_g224_i0_p8_GENE_NODE_268_length_10573_cov_173_829050_g224_i0NODE_268_length_10573_cov_173_829050_g224_i0_p8_ORF_typecomplete_len245_score27_75G10/PF01125_17/3_2e67Mito_fiss_reg/PF05308_11/6_3CAP_N/PF01213_19/7_3_NODE_268_length_10573_cov_173_829050_g224_i072637997